MIVNIEKNFLKGEINAILSKSYLHRIMICDYLAGNPVKIGNNSQDVFATKSCLDNLKTGNLDCGESGSTLRFMLPLCSAIGGEYSFTCHGRLAYRPNDELFNVLRENGMFVEQTDKIHLKGKLKSGEYKIRGDISSQYISGLLMALPILEGDSLITLTSPLVSSPYVDITLEVLKGYGIKIEKILNGFKVYGNQIFRGELLAEGDWSNGAFMLVAGAINGEILVKNLNLESVQADREIYNVLKNANASMNLVDNGLYVEKSNLNAFLLDAEDCPDIVPIASVLASFCKGETEIKNISRLKIKESDRVVSTISMLNSFGIKAIEDNNRLIVYGGKAHFGVIETFNDHRIAMSASVMASGINGVSKILGAECVNKSYPDFYKDLESLGAKITRE